jgi:hypothetical protein
MEKKWEELSVDEKQEALFQKWLSPEGVKFDNPQAEKAFKDRATRLKDAIQLKKKPDRVPVFSVYGFYPARYAGFTPQEVMYDYDKCNLAWEKFILDFAPDGHIGTYVPGPGKVYDILDYKLYSWPGHGVASSHCYQCNEKEYMKPEEYEALIEDPSNYFSNTFLPRAYGSLAQFSAPGLTNLLEIYGSGLNFIPFGLPPVQAAYKTLFEAGNEALKWVGSTVAYNNKMAAAGFPQFWDGASKPPFDMLGDTLRGTKGIMLDLYRRPDKVLKAMDVLTPIVIKIGIASSRASGVPVVTIVLHKGADGFLSDAQYKKFYWPTFRRLLMGLIAEGIVPFCFAEGGYNSRLEIIKDLPEGKVIWWFDQTDIAKAKKILGDRSCIGGNLPSDLLAVGTPEQIKHYVKNLVDTCASGGGYILGNGTVIEDARPENLKAMIDFTKEYGVYH